MAAGKTLKLGYVGCGFMAQKVHIPNIVALQNEGIGCELTALAELRPKLREKVCKRFGISQSYASHAELAKDRSIQAVALSGQFAAQGEIAVDLLNAGKDVFMEKPMAVSLAQAERIVAAEKKSGRRLMIAYMKRYDAGNVLFKKLLDGFISSGELGPVNYVRNHGFCGNWTGGLDTPMDQTDEPYPPAPEAWPSWLPAANRNGYVGYLQQYTHNVNLVRWFITADKPVTVRAVDLDANGVSGVVILDIGGVRVVIESGSVAYHGWEEHTQIYFAKGWMKTAAPPLLLRNTPATVEIYRGDKEHKEETVLHPANGYTWAYKEEMRHFITSLNNDEPFRSPATDALEDVRTLENIYRKHVAAAE